MGYSLIVERVCCILKRGAHKVARIKSEEYKRLVKRLVLSRTMGRHPYGTSLRRLVGCSKLSHFPYFTYTETTP